LAKDVITNMNEASEAVAAALPVTVALGDGSVVTVHKIGWINFKSLWKELVDVLKEILRLQVSQGQISLKNENLTLAYAASISKGGESDSQSNLTAIQAAQSEATEASDQMQGIYNSAMEHLLDAPALVTKIITFATDAPADTVDQWSFDDVLAVVSAAINVNFIANQRVRDFFANVMSAYNLAAPVTAPQSAPVAKRKK
jgi:hypothetical protein